MEKNEKLQQERFYMKRDETKITSLHASNLVCSENVH
jgi:hypothetical protein